MAGLNTRIDQDPNYFWDLQGWTNQDLINANESGAANEGGEVSMTKAPEDSPEAEEAKAADKDKASSKTAQAKASADADK